MKAISKSGIKWSLLGVLPLIFFYAVLRGFMVSDYVSYPSRTEWTVTYIILASVIVIGVMPLLPRRVFLWAKTTSISDSTTILEKKYHGTARLVVDADEVSATALEEKYGRTKFVFGLDESPMAAAFKLPPRTPVHSPYTGTVTAMNRLSGGTSLVTVLECNTQNYFIAEHTGEMEVTLQENGVGYIKKGDVLLRTGKTNLEGKEFDSYNLLLFFKKDGGWNNAKVREVFGISLG